MKQFLSIMMAVILCVSVNATSVSAAEVEEAHADEATGITWEITEWNVVPNDARATYATGNTDFQVQGQGTLTLPAHTSVTSLQAFARIASGGAAPNVTIKILGAGLPASGASVAVTESYKTVSSFSGITNNSNSSRQYTFTFNASEWTQHYGIALFFN